MTDNIKMPPMPKPHTPPVFATAANTPSVKAGYELGGYEKTPPLFDEHQLEAFAREAVRLNAHAVPDGWKLVPVEATPDMCKAAVIYANGNAVYKNVAHEALEIEESIYSEVYAAMLSAAPAAPQPAAQQPLTDEQCDAIYTALDTWARKADAYEFGLPRAYGDGAKGGREIIRNAISGVKND